MDRFDHLNCTEKEFVPHRGHTASKRQGWDSNRCLSDPKAIFLTISQTVSLMRNSILDINMNVVADMF